MHLPLIAADLPGIAGSIKSSPASFVVEEIAAYKPCGAGEHLFLWIEKVDRSAEQLLMHIARSLGIDRRDVGMAGLKDRRAITRQWISVPASCESRVGAIESEQVKVLHSSRHRNKLKTGHLRGNRFVITITGVEAGDLERAERIRDRLRETGIANYYGDQRFGHDDETLRLGLALLRGEASERDIPHQRRRFLTRLAISAVQSWMFNRVLAERIGDGLVRTVQAGDVLQVAASGGLFVCEEPGVDQRRCDAGEVVITGPMFGVKMRSPLHEPLERERRVLETSAITGEMWQRWSRFALGARRALVVRVDEIAITQREANSLDLSFALPSGAYATSLLREFARDAARG